MRYDTPVFFQRVQAGAYNQSSGDYGADIVEETKQYASVTDATTEQLTLVFGGIKQGALVIRLQRGYKMPFDRIRVGDKLYKVDFARYLKTFIVSEVQ
jgi:hypothetical protein